MKQREQGQIVAIFALSLVALLAVVGVVLDGGNIYLQRRTAQNAADAAAIAGTRALLNAAVTPDTTISAEICNYATSNAFGVVPTPTAYFVGLDGVTNQGSISLPTNCSGSVSNVIPSGVVAGVHVDVSIPFNTYVAGFIGVSNVTAQAGATGQVGAGTGVAAADAPVAGCGVMMDTGTSSTPNIFVGGTPPTIDYASWMGTSFNLQSSQLWKYSTHPPCPRFNQGNGDWKGTLGGSGTISLPSNQPTSNGNSAAPVNTACTNAGQGDPTLGGVCYLAIPITDGNNPQSGTGIAHVVAFACMQVFGIVNGTTLWTGTIANPRNCGASNIYTYTYNWTWAPGSYSFARVALTH
jgi:hypothetical protein